MTTPRQEGLDPVTLGELYRLQLAFQQETRKALSDLTGQISSRTVSLDVWRAEHEALEHRVKELEADQIRHTERSASVAVGLVLTVTGSIGAIIAAVVANVRVH